MLIFVKRRERSLTLREASFLSATISRRRALRFGLKGAALCASPATAAAPAICPPDPGPAGVSAVEAAITTAQSQGDIASISYALISCGKVFAANAYGTASPNVEASSATLYQAASISKTLGPVAGLYAVQTNAKVARSTSTSALSRRRGNCRAGRPASRCDGFSA